MTDLLDLMTYPHHAGAKEPTTSLEAAIAIESEGRAGRLREQVKSWYARGYCGTADECAAALGESILSIRPRVSELHRLGVLEPSGDRRRSDGGRMANVWVLA
jgi:hypothetical protein